MRPEPVVVPSGLLRAAGSAPLAELLWRRGLRTPEEALAFLEAEAVDDTGLPGLAEGAALLAKAVRTRRPLHVFGDYDADGVTATALMVAALRAAGATPSWQVPDRFTEGYGLHAGAVEQLVSGALLVAVDCGTTAVDEALLARERGIDLVIADHHAPTLLLPDAAALINPKLLPEGDPLGGLTGSGVAWLLARRMLLELGRDPAEADAWLDLAAVGLIGDRAPLAGAARVLVRRGLDRLRSTPCPGLRALLREAEVEGPPDEEEVGYQVVPRLNAAGRLADAGVAVRLLLAGSEAEAAPAARELSLLNGRRKELTAAIMTEAGAALARAEPGPLIALYGPGWHEGCVGIAAGQLCERHGLPAILLTRREDGRTAVGSARAPAGYPLLSLLEQVSGHLARWGGHAAAAGLSLPEEAVPALLGALRAAAAAVAWEPPPPAAADLEVPLAAVDELLYRALLRAAPFGEANPAPLFYMPGVRVLSIRTAGDGEHLRLVVRDGDASFSAIWFGAAGRHVALGPADLLCRLRLNRYQGRETLQLLVRDLLPPGGAAPGAPVPDAAAPGAAVAVAAPEWIDRRGEAPELLREEFGQALAFAEGAARPPFPTADRYGIRKAETLLLLDLPPSVGILEEMVALSGAARVVFGWRREPLRAEDRFFPALMKTLEKRLQPAGAVRLRDLALRLRELEPAVARGIEALAASHLLAVLDREGDLWRLRRREGTSGLRESAALQQVRQMLKETRAFRRHFRTAPLAVLKGALHLH